MGALIHSVLAQLSSARPPRQYVSLYEEANGCCPCHVHDELCWLWNWLWNCHDDVPTVHATSACPDYGSPTVHATSACPDYGSPAVHATGACPDYCSPADDGSASTCPDYGSPAIHWGSTNTCTNQRGERCFYRNQHDQRCFFRNSDSACLVPPERDNASCKIPR